ncbi:MAG: LysM peptidoglycan-binding domain-containing protein [Cytophagales bacterium]|nr:LysM peptidoglycan-binding domain-containing protein [Cytophagales bacterium]
MKKYIHFLLVALLCTGLSMTSFAQKKSKAVRIADKYFEVEDYYLATDFYKKELENDINNAYAVYQLGECHRHFFDYEMAKKWYARCLELDADNYPLARYYYGVMLKVEGEYQKAEEALLEFMNTYEPTDSSDRYKELAQLEYDGAALALDELQKPIRDFEFHNVEMGVNTSYSEFSPAIYQNDSSIIFASSRLTEKNDDIHGHFGEGFVDNFWFEKTEDGWVERTHKNEKLEVINSEFNDGAGVFSKERDRYYFTRCDIKIPKTKKYECAIYVTRDLQGEKWSDPVPLNNNINLAGTWNAQPALSPNDDTLFFVSKRDGGYGEHDIWYSVLIDDGIADNWGEAVNMGERINTPYVELSPSYYRKENVLFFASNGHLGFGGLDIFMVRKGGNNDTIQNLGLPFNSNKDDFAFVLGDKKGYLTSNRETGQGNDDLFKFNIKSKEALIAKIDSKELLEEGAETVNVKGTILSQGVLAKGAIVMLKDSAGMELTRIVTKKDGYFEFNELDPNKNYKITVDDENATLLNHIVYRVGDLRIEGNNSNIAPTDSSEIEKRIAVKGRILDEKGLPREGVTVALLDGELKELKTTTTDKDGLFVFADLEPGINYSTVVKDKRGRVKNDDDAQVNNVLVSKVNKNDVNTTSLDVASTGEVASRVSFESIYFATDKYRLTDESKQVLDKLVSYLQSSSIKLKIEINGYTDSVGEEGYNVKLGNRRAKSTYKYLVKKGVDKSMIVVNAIGEKNPAASNATVEGRRLNRRVEVFVIGGGEYSAKAMIHIIPPKTSLDDLANQYGMTVEEIKKVNNLNSDILDAYKPIRVRKNSFSNAPLMIAGQGTGNPVRPSSGNTVTFNNQYNQGVVYNKYDGSGYYMVLPKNTLFSIAKVCNISLDELRKLNNLTAASTIYPGQVLKVNAHVVETKEEYTNRTTLADAGVNVSEQAGEVFSIGKELRYVVKEGDTFYSVCKAFNMGFEELRMLNNLPNFVLSPRMVLRVKAPKDEESDNQ